MKKLFSALFTFVLLSSMSSIGAHAQDKNCGDFSSHSAVMDFWYNNGYSATNDPHGLDRDNDGLPCEVSKGEYDTYVADRQSAGDTPGETMPDTATNNVPMMLMGVGLVGVGILFIFRRKKGIE
jgi:LPXTG-motif cell wall-anchored protein